MTKISQDEKMQFIKNAILKFDNKINDVNEVNKNAHNALMKTLDNIKLDYRKDLKEFSIALRQAVIADVTLATLKFDKARLMADLERRGYVEDGN